MQPPLTRPLLALSTAALVMLGVALAPASSYAADPEPGSPAYVARDAQNIQDAYGRITGPGGQLQNPAYPAALILASTAYQTHQLMEQAASPTRIAVTPGRVVPGWNVGNPLRAGWNGTRGLSERISFTSGGSSLTPKPTPEGPDPMRERATGYDAWRKAGVDSMLVVPRASTHLEYTDIPPVLPASRYGQDLSSHYAQAWLDRYLKHRSNASALTGSTFRYLEPAGNGRWQPVTLPRASLLSCYYCSAYGFRSGSRVLSDGDIGDVGGCA